MATYRVTANYEIHFRVDVEAKNYEDAYNAVYFNMSEVGLVDIESNNSFDEFNREYNVEDVSEIK